MSYPSYMNNDAEMAELKGLRSRAALLYSIPDVGEEATHIEALRAAAAFILFGSEIAGLDPALLSPGAPPA